MYECKKPIWKRKTFHLFCVRCVRKGVNPLQGNASLPASRQNDSDQVCLIYACFVISSKLMAKLNYYIKQSHALCLHSSLQTFEKVATFLEVLACKVRQSLESPTPTLQE